MDGAPCAATAAAPHGGAVKDESTDSEGDYLCTDPEVNEKAVHAVDRPHGILSGTEKAEHGKELQQAEQSQQCGDIDQADSTNTATQRLQVKEEREHDTDTSTASESEGRGFQRIDD